jgi:hypothetical protein
VSFSVPPVVRQHTIFAFSACSSPVPYRVTKLNLRRFLAASMPIVKIAFSTGSRPLRARMPIKKIKSAVSAVFPENP